MLAQMGLSPDALADLSANKHGAFATRLAWDALEQALHSHGSLLLASDSETSRFIEMVKGQELTVDERKRLATLITRMKKENRIDVASPPLNGPLSQVASPEEVASLQGGAPLVAILPDETFKRLYPDNSEGIADIGENGQAVVAQVLSQSGCLRKLQEVAEAENYSGGVPRERVWNELFASLAQRFPRVSIVDRYFLSELINRESRFQQGSFRDPEHVGWLLSKLDENAPQGTWVTLHTQIENPHRDGSGPVSAEGVLDLIDRNWKAKDDGRLGGIEVYGVEWKPRSHPHNRHIRFGEALGFKLDEGFDRLAQPRIAFDSGFSYSYAWKPEQVQRMRRDENLIRLSPDVDFAQWDLHS